jgi:hypothetical protein
MSSVSSEYKNKRFGFLPLFHNNFLYKNSVIYCLVFFTAMKHIKSVSRKQKIPNSRHILYLLFKLTVIVILFFLIAKYKALILVLLFEVLDFFKTVLRRCIPFLPIDFEFIFGITVAYYYGFIYSIIIYCLSIINRTILSSIELRHISKGIRHIPLFFFATFLHIYPFFPVAMVLLVINYLFKFLLKISTLQPLIEKTQYNIINFLAASFFFYMISVIYYYLPFLA